MERLEKLIRENSGLFDSFEPSDGHLERFRSKLDTRGADRPRTISILPHLLKAAVVAILISLSSLWTWEHLLSPDSHMMSLSDVSPEYSNVEQYYVRQVNMMEDEILSIDITGDPEQKDMLMNEIGSMDQMYEDLQRDLKANPNDQRVINAMIEHYQKKVEVLNYILSQLKEINSNNQLNNENYETVRL